MRGKILTALSINKVSCSDGNDYIRLEVVDLGTRRRVMVKISLENFAQVITGRSVECNVAWFIK